MPKKKPDGKWNSRISKKAYELLRLGYKQREVAAELNVPTSRWNSWLRTKPGFRAAVDKGKEEALTRPGRPKPLASNYDRFMPLAEKNREGIEHREAKHVVTFTEYVYRRLPAHLRPAWDEIMRCETDPSLERRVEVLLDGLGRRARQHLFVYALSYYRFSKSMACRAVNLSHDELCRWLREDPDFASIVNDELHLARKDFCEHGLMKKIEEGDTSAIIFANRTLNADRGYMPPPRDINVNHQGGVAHLHLPVEIRDLPLAGKKALLDEVRKRKKELEGPREVRGVEPDEPEIVVKAREP